MEEGKYFCQIYMYTWSVSFAVLAPAGVAPNEYERNVFYTILSYPLKKGRQENCVAKEEDKNKSIMLK